MRQAENKVQKAYKYISAEFFPASEYEPAGVEIEAYPSADIRNADYTREIWIAVKKIAGRKGRVSVLFFLPTSCRQEKNSVHGFG